MFETEDMLPRPPPRPSAPPNEVASIPTVPEVSLIFGKPIVQSQTNQQTTPPSYAAWKKQNLPRVTFPPNLNDEPNYVPAVSSSSGYITTRSSVYPMRTVTVSTTMASSGATTSSASSCGNDKTSTQMMSLDTPPSSLSQFSYRSEQRRSMDSLSQRSQAADPVLTICASTQTDAVKTSMESAIEPFKQEFTQLMDIVKQLREEQHQMRQVMETFLVQQQQLIQAQLQQQVQATLQVYCCDKATQCETENGNANDTRRASLDVQQPFNMENGTLHRALPNVKIYSQTIKETPHPTIPVAQSTVYRANTPLNIRQNSPITVQSNNQHVQNITTLPKPSTERSMVMNELALKYLPSDKLNELMQDAQITTVGNSNKRPVPLLENDNFNKAPTDISNASYKYLRKYRLLPDENRNSPTHNGLQSSPYQQRMQDSPIACLNGRSGANAESPHLDLEHIRRQPKFL